MLLRSAQVPPTRRRLTTGKLEATESLQVPTQSPRTPRRPGVRTRRPQVPLPRQAAEKLRVPIRRLRVPMNRLMAVRRLPRVRGRKPARVRMLLRELRSLRSALGPRWVSCTSRTSRRTGSHWNSATSSSDSRNRPPARELPSVQRQTKARQRSRTPMQTPISQTPSRRLLSRPMSSNHSPNKQTLSRQAPMQARLTRPTAMQVRLTRPTTQRKPPTRLTSLRRSSPTSRPTLARRVLRRILTRLMARAPGTPRPMGQLPGMPRPMGQVVGMPRPLTATRLRVTRGEPR